MLNKAILLTTILIFATTCPAKAPLKVFIFAGQSNMVGAAAKTEELPHPLQQEQKNLAFHKGQWKPLKPGTTQNPDREGFGPEISFATAMAKHLGEPIGIIKYARGGTNLHTQWNVEKQDHPKSLYAALKSLVEKAKAQKDIEIIGMIWMQGEADAKVKDIANAYGDHYRKLITHARIDFHNPTLPFVAGRINPAHPDRFTPEIVEITRKHQENPKMDHYAWVNCDDLKKIGDKVHYSTTGLVTMGERMAEKIIALQK